MYKITLAFLLPALVLSVMVLGDLPFGLPLGLLGLGVLLDGEAAREEVERYLDRAHAAGVGQVRIVHGHGTGALRRMVTDVCRTHPAVRS